MEDVQILSIIGAGAFAVVYRGVYQGGDVAIKLATIEPEKSGWKEAFVACQLRHPHVVATYTARGALLSKEFFDQVWSTPPPALRHPAPPRDALPALPSDDGLGCPRKVKHEQQGWKAVLSRVGASPNKGLLMLIQERCDQGNLTRAIKSGFFKTDADKGPRAQLLARRMLLRTATEICRGMLHLHRASVVHGDLKPANVLLHSSSVDRRGFVAKIADFGLARVLQKDVTAVQSETTGTLPYMSPEAFNGVHSKASDVYAFGVLLFEMLTGSPPYESVPPGRIMMGVSFQGLRPPWPAAEWPELCALGTRCLDQDPAKRPSFKQLEEELIALEEAVRESSRRASTEGVQQGEDPRQSFAAGDGASVEAAAAAAARGRAAAGGGSRSASPSPPASPRPRHRLAVAGGSTGGGAGGGGAGGAAPPPPTAQRSSLELRRAAAATAAAAAAAAALAASLDVSPAAVAPLAQEACAPAAANAGAVAGADIGAGVGAAATADAAAAAAAAATAASAAAAAASSNASEPVSPWATAFATAQPAVVAGDGEAAE